MSTLKTQLTTPCTGCCKALHHWPLQKGAEYFTRESRDTFTVWWDYDSIINLLPDLVVKKL